MGNDINDTKLVGGKKKNGHKSNCSCHICENMKNKAKRGGYQEEEEKAKEYMMGGSKKKNGHRKACKCPICKNMKNFKKREREKSNKTKKRRDNEEEDEEEDEEDEEDENSDSGSDSSSEEHDKDEKKRRGNGHKPNCKCPIYKNMRKKKGGQEPDIENQIIKSNETPASEDDYDALDAAERGEAGQNVVGGTRRRRRGGKKKWNCNTQRNKTRKTRRRR